jgi:hypothetical protein
LIRSASQHWGFLWDEIYLGLRSLEIENDAHKTGVRLIIFDLDGTLAETMKVDAECFLSSFAEVFGVTGIDTVGRNTATRPIQWAVSGGVGGCLEILSVART